MIIEGVETPISPIEYRVLIDSNQRQRIKSSCVEMVRSAEDASAVIFLDKGARPLAAPFRKLFPALFPPTTYTAYRFC